MAGRTVGEFLLEPAERTRESRSTDVTIAVIALGPRCGCTTVARGLAFAASAGLVRDEDGGLEDLAGRDGPVVIEVPHGQPAAVAVSLAHAVIVVAGPAVEPALAVAATNSLAGISRCFPLVAAWGPEPARWDGVADLVLPTAPMAARLVRRGLVSPGALARALEALNEQARRG